VLREEPLTIFGDGTQSRDFVYIDDVVEAWSRALAAPATFGQVFNLGSAHGLAIKELARQVLAVCRRPSTADVIRRAPARSGEQRHVEADIARIRKALSWQPTVPFEVGLRKTYEWAESRRAG
jgi:UDP-glucose 4-epimerase